MPNYITNRLTISGEPEAVKKLFTELRTEGINETTNFIDFNKIIPMPKSLEIAPDSRSSRGLAFVSATKYNDFEKLDQDLQFYKTYNYNGPIKNREDLLELYMKNAKKDPEFIKIGQQCYDNIQNYGAPTWYEWANENWGTKWNACNQIKVNENTIEFNTSLVGVPNLIAILAERFQELDFFYQYADEDRGCNVSEYSFQNGVCIDMNSPENESPEAYRIAADVLGEDLSSEDNFEEYEMEP